ncbi:hypothetical protein PHSY_000816 [Pseudozyma hubeiensis SY62]|uniref:Uncharacterized protein n=1 Tax=Pseudozyma hubeiensis (strain SY62) TaxID=1305764 RepID=R9NXH0_PSEHS|nr:hypothetical protein PHSY_000816 [Pseudozyma hubeiensis SY62]GAC93252.1 hypothetical protein PHSY_000816 [Pseudozyma hubeiensis SY62]
MSVSMVLGEICSYEGVKRIGAAMREALRDAGVGDSGTSADEDEDEEDVLDDRGLRRPIRCGELEDGSPLRDFDARRGIRDGEAFARP